MRLLSLKSVTHIIAMLWLPHFAVAQPGIGINAEALARALWQENATSHFDIMSNTSNAQRYELQRIPLDVDDASLHIVVRTSADEGKILPGYMLFTDGSNPTLLAFDSKASFFDTRSKWGAAISTNDMPEHIRKWMKGYKAMNKDVTQAELAAWRQASTSSYPDVLPLLCTREWGQNNPYNLRCPVFDDKHCPTGCVATALAQIMCHHKWPQKGKGNIAYTTSTQKININLDFNSIDFEWDKLDDTYIPLEDLSSNGDTVVTDTKYYMNLMTVDNNSVPLLKCYVTISNLMVMGMSSFNGEIVLLITDDNNKLVGRISTSVAETVHTGKIVNSHTFLIYIPSTIADGTYRIYCAVRDNSSAWWSLANVDNEKNYLTMEKAGYAFTIGSDMYPCCPSSEDVEPISTLMQAVGAAVKMDYNIDGSGSTDNNVIEGLTTYLGYDPDLFFAYPDNYTDEQWHEMLQKELVEGRPVYYTGQGIESGHAFVIDGFRKTDDGTTYYHINWGWDGLCNGYYLLNMLRPSSTGTGGSYGSNYANQPSMLIGMKPDDGIADYRMNCSGLEVLTDEYCVGDFMPIRIRGLSLQSSRDFTGTINLGLQGMTSAQGSKTVHTLTNTMTYRRGLANYYASCQLPSDMMGGRYQLIVTCTTDNGDNVEVRCDEWPTISVKGANSWMGGPLTQPMKKVAVAGTLSVSAQETEGIVTLTVDSIVNPIPIGTTGQLALVICDQSGRMLAEPTTLSPVSVTGYGVRRNANLSTFVSRHMPDGDYELHIGFLPLNETLWTYCDMAINEGSLWWAYYCGYSIPLTIDNGMVTLLYSTTFEGADTPWTTGINNLCLGSFDDEAQNCRWSTLNGQWTIGHWQWLKGIKIMRKNNRYIKVIK